MAACSNRSARRTLAEFGFWIAVLLPNLTVGRLIMLFDGCNNLVNQPFQSCRSFLDGLDIPRGGDCRRALSGAIAVGVMLLVPAFRNLDSSLEEASLASEQAVWGPGARDRADSGPTIPAVAI